MNDKWTSMSCLVACYLQYRGLNGGSSITEEETYRGKESSLNKVKFLLRFPSSSLHHHLGSKKTASKPSRLHRATSDFCRLILAGWRWELTKPSTSVQRLAQRVWGDVSICLNSIWLSLSLPFSLSSINTIEWKNQTALASSLTDHFKVEQRQQQPTATSTIDHWDPFLNVTLSG